MNDGAITGGAVQAQLAAVTLALVALRSMSSRAFARRATIRGAANALRQTRPGSAAVALAIDRQLALLEGFDKDASGDAVEAALRAEAEADDRRGIRGPRRARRPRAGGARERRRVRGPRPDAWAAPGAMGSGQFGTALSAIITAHHAERPIHALVAETRPGLEGARVATWELAQAGVPHALVTDAGAAAAIAAGEVDAVLVTAERICANGDVIGVTGTYPLALAAAAADVPFVVLVATTAVDLGTPDAAAATLEEGRPRRRPDRGRDADRARGHVDPQPAARSDAGLAAERDHHRGGRHPGAVRRGARRARAGDGCPPGRVAGLRGAPRRAGRGGRLMATVAVGTRPGLVARATTDRAVLRQFLERDRLLAAYAICDLEDREFARTKWGVATPGRRGRRDRHGVRRPHAPADVPHGRSRRHRRDPARRRPAPGRLPRRARRVAAGRRAALPDRGRARR